MEREVVEKLQDVLSLVILLENDMENQKMDVIYIRIMGMIHKKLKQVICDMEKSSQ